MSSTTLVSAVGAHPATAASATAAVQHGSALAAKKKPKGTLQIALTGIGSYTVTGKGFRKSGSASKSFKVAAGAYKVSAPGATVSRGSVKVKAGKKATVTVAFPPAPVETAPPVQTPPPSDPTTPPPPPVDTTPPGKVTALVAGTRTPSSIVLSWTNPTDSDLAEVIVRRERGATAPASPTAGAGVALGTPKASSVTDKGLTSGTTYSYAVFTRDASNNTNPAPATVITNTTTTARAIQRVSTSADGLQGDGGSYGADLSPDGTKIAFASDASNLVADDTNGLRDVFVKTLASGVIQRVSVDASGTQGDGETWDFAWSPDGTKIAFASDASNLVADDTNGLRDVFVKTLASGVIQRVSVDASGTQGDGAAKYPAWSPDGTKIAFASAASNLVPNDTNGQGDVFVKTLGSGVIQRVSVDASGNQSNDWSYSDESSWSPDGTRIAFTSAASNLVPGDTNGQDDVFVKALSSGTIIRVSTDKDGTQAVSSSWGPAWSPDSSSVSFVCNGPLVGDDTNHTLDAFIKNLATQAVQRVSTSSTGSEGNGASYEVSWSPDGTRVAFYSFAANLVPVDSNATGDVFVKTLATGATERVSLDATGAQGNGGSYGYSWSPDGTRLAFRSEASNLVSGDTNGVSDVFVKTLS